MSTAGWIATQIARQLAYASISQEVRTRVGEQIHWLFQCETLAVFLASIDLIAGAFQRGYEANYEDRLTKCISLGDTVWDIGPNVGLYTVQFANQVGARGVVVAFEPSKVNFLRLTHTCQSLRNVELQPFGLGEDNETTVSSKGLTTLVQQAKSAKTATLAMLLKFESVMT
jgi:hypothetical protein